MSEEILDAMEQGATLWSPEGECLYVSKRLHSVLEFGIDEVKVGMRREEFFAKSLARGEFSAKWGKKLRALAGKTTSFTYDRHLPSGRIVATTVRRLDDGRDIVTYTDVTSARKLVAELDAAKKAAEEAENKTATALEFEKARQHQIAMLSLLGEWLQSCKSLDELYRVISAHLEKLLPGMTGELYIYSNSRDVLEGACSWGQTPLLDHIQADDCWSLRRGRCYTYGADEVEFECGHVSEQNWSAQGRRYLCIPIIAHGDTTGLLHVKLKECCTAENEEDIAQLADLRRFIIQCAEHISLAVANVKLRDELRDQTVRDTLTGLYNRRYLLDNMRRETVRATKLAEPMSIISFDADHFKKFNDNHGHDAGDTVLRHLSELMQTLFHGDEINCRFGGEEFTILLPDTDHKTALRRAEDLRAATEAMVIRYGNQNLPRMTLSLGVATLPVDGTCPQTLLAAADKALYRAKERGRNQVCTANEAEPVFVDDGDDGARCPLNRSVRASDDELRSTVR